MTQDKTTLDYRDLMTISLPKKGGVSEKETLKQAAAKAGYPSLSGWCLAVLRKEADKVLKGPNARRDGTTPTVTSTNKQSPKRSPAARPKTRHQKGR